MLALVAEREFIGASKRLASRIRANRVRLGLTQEEAADAIGLVPRHYQKLEAGRLNVTLRTLVKVAAAFKLSLKDLF
jgi:transcriptional regulator with XRE-family HTH domain